MSNLSSSAPAVASDTGTWELDLSYARSILQSGCILAALTVLACASPSKQAEPELPPRVDLSEWRTVGIANFAGETHPGLARRALADFVAMLRESQPDARLVELGDVDPDLDYRDVLELRDHRGVDAVFTGFLELAQSQPRAGGSVEIEGELTAILTETHSGARIWSGSATSRIELPKVGAAEVGVDRPAFAQRKPEWARGTLVRELVSLLRHDFESATH